MSKNAGLYIRVSTEHQANEGYSVAAQKNNLTKFALDNNFNIYSIYSDEGISGKNIENRPEVKRLIKDIELGLLEIILIYKFDRLTRNISDTEDFINIIQKYEITIYTLSEGEVDVSTPQGRFVTRLKGAVAQLEREQTVERIKVAFVQKVKEGYSLCSRTTCYGYNRKKGNKIMTINKKEANIVNRIFKMYINNNNFTSIAKILNSEGVPTKLYGRIVNIKKNKDVIGIKKITSIWQPKMIRLILSNPTYIGKVRYGIGTKQYFECDGLHKPIIPLNIWNKVQEKINKIKHISRTNLPKEDVYYCGTLVCGLCDHKLTTNRTIIRLKKNNNKNLFNGYRCINREKGTCTAIGMSHRKVEKAFIKYLDIINGFDVLDELIINPEENINNEKIICVKKVIANTNNKLKEVMNMFMLNRIDNNQLTYMSNKLRNTINENEKRLKELLKDEHVPTINKNKISKNIKDHWLFLTNKEKLAFLNNFIEKIVIVNNQNREIEILDIKFYN